MSDAREALAALILERFRAAETYMDLPRQAGLLADAILAAGWTPPGERVKPSVEDVARVIEDVLCEHRIVHVETIHGTVYRCEHSECDYDTADWTAWEEHVAPHVARALVPGRTETEVKAEVWDEGFTAGLRRADFEYGHATIQAVQTNPYRKEADRG